MKVACVTALISASVLAVGVLVIAPVSAAPPPPSPNPAKVSAAEHLREHGGLRSAPSVAAGKLRLAIGHSNNVVLIIKTDTSVRLSSVKLLARAQNMAVRRSIPALRAVSVEVPAGQQAAAIARLRALPGVRSVEVAVTRHFDGVPSDPDYAPDQSSYLGAVNAPPAWDVQHGSAAVTIAVIDSGVDVYHPDLSGKITASYNAVDGTSDVTDTLGHGTFVAGVAGASTGNGVGIAGAGYDTSLLAVKVAAADNTITVDAESAGIVWAADHGANVINLSLGGTTASTTESDAIAYAQGKGVLIVAAAGNDASSTLAYPAAYPSVVAVGATDGTGRASFSNFGTWVSVAAPGINIFSTTPTAGSQFFPAPGGASYATGDGTSFATPIVAGEAALIKAQAPTATASTLRTALVQSAHGYAGLGLGTGQVDFSAALQHITPDTTPTVQATGTAGTVAISASSTAPAVEFQIDSGAFTAPIATSAGLASYEWSSWGFANGPHTVRAIDCSTFAECAATSASAAVTLANVAPTVTAPATGASITGGFTITATSPGGGLRFLIDGTRRGFDATSPYSLPYTGSALPEGDHTLQVVQCSTSESLCGGPLSPVTSFRSISLHPSITSLTPNPFSPNGDKAKDTTRVTISLPNPQIVYVRIFTASGAEVRGPVRLGALSAGVHGWTWNGHNNGGYRLSDGNYTMQVDTSKAVNGATVRGSVSRTIRLDTTAPVMSSLSGASATFYPYPDGYADAFSPSLTLNEGASLTLVIRTPSGATVRVIRASKAKGRASLTWNGRNSANRRVAAGTYIWYFQAVDAASNVRRTHTYAVNVSGKRLIGKTAAITKNGINYSSVQANNPSCVDFSTSLSDFYPRGVWLDNACDPSFDGFSIIDASYRFTLPAAVKYGNMKMQVYGNSIFPPTGISAGFYRPATASFDVPTTVRVGTSSNAWYTLGSVPAAGHYTARVATVDFAVDNNYGAPSDFDIGYARLTVTYYVLQ